MQFNELVKIRQSCRNYSGKAVEKEKLLEIVEGAKNAPSACNSQPWFFHLVHTPEKVKAIADCVNKLGFNKFAQKAGAFIVVELTEPKLKEGVTKVLGSKYFADNDIGIVTAYLTLCASNIGLSTCIMGMFDKGQVIKELSLNKKAELKLVIAVGYPAEEDVIRDKIRKETEDISKTY